MERLDPAAGEGVGIAQSVLYQIAPYGYAYGMTRPALMLVCPHLSELGDK